MINSATRGSKNIGSYTSHNATQKHLSNSACISGFQIKLRGLKAHDQWQKFSPKSHKRYHATVFIGYWPWSSINFNTTGEKTHPVACPCPRPGCPSGLAGWLAPWWCWSRCSCQHAGCCGSASRSSRCGSPAELNRTGAGLESRGCGDSARSGRTTQYAGVREMRGITAMTPKCLVSFVLMCLHFRLLAVSHLSFTSLIITDIYVCSKDQGIHWN